MSASCSCPGSVLRAIRSDAGRCTYSLSGDGRVTAGGIARVGLLFPGLWAVILYRLTHHLYYRFRPRALGRLLYAPMCLISRLSGIVLGIEIAPHAHIGCGLFINHFGGIHIGEVSIGENCNISHGVSFTDSPVLGDRVWVGPGAIISGPVKVGHDSVVAGNSLVTDDVPSFAVVMGVPAAVVSRKGSFTQVTYRGMTDDPGRSAALAALAEQRAERGAGRGAAGPGPSGPSTS